MSADKDNPGRRRRRPISMAEALSRTYSVHPRNNGTYGIAIPQPVGELLVGKRYRWRLTDTGVALDIVEPTADELPAWAMKSQ